jgi:hypothetical protein
MPLHHVHPNHLPAVWPVALPLLKKAMDLEPGSHNEQFIEYSIRTGKTHLLVWEEPGEGITGACTIEFIDYPMERVAHVNLMGGKGVVRDYVFEEAKEFMRRNGAKKAQCWARGTLVDMYKKMGMENTHQVMRVTL